MLKMIIGDTKLKIFSAEDLLVVRSLGCISSDELLSWDLPIQPGSVRGAQYCRLVLIALLQQSGVAPVLKIGPTIAHHSGSEAVKR